jgi:hypothetical protein
VRGIEQRAVPRRRVPARSADLAVVPEGEAAPVDVASAHDPVEVRREADPVSGLVPGRVAAADLDEEAGENVEAVRIEEGGVPGERERCRLAGKVEELFAGESVPVRTDEALARLGGSPCRHCRPCRVVPADLDYGACRKNADRPYSRRPREY